jgi:hypothetical protein
MALAPDSGKTTSRSLTNSLARTFHMSTSKVSTAATDTRHGFVRFRQAVAGIADLSRDEMTEVASRAMNRQQYPECDFYVELFRAHCKHPSGTDLMFWPSLVSELPRGREPTVEEIANLAMGGGSA